MPKLPEGGNAQMTISTEFSVSLFPATDNFILYALDDDGTPSENFVEGALSDENLGKAIRMLVANPGLGPKAAAAMLKEATAK